MNAPDRPRRILIVEDEWLIAETMADDLTNAGFEIVGPAASVAQASALLEREEIDAALLDVSLGAEKSYPIAHALRARQVPFVFLSGFFARDLPPDLAGSPLLTKPVAAPALLAALGNLRA